MNVEQLANIYVNATEQTNLERMAYEAKDSHAQALGCGCHGCSSRAAALGEAFSKESHRVNVWSPDHEEELITNFYSPVVKE